MQPLRVLVAEDHETGRAVLAAHLGGAGFDLVFAEDGARAVEAAAAGSFDIILMDLRMPVMDGFDAIRAIRRQEAERGAPPAPIVVISANSGVEDVRRCLEAGADAHLPKPVSRAVLLQALLAHGPEPSTAG